MNPTAIQEGCIYQVNPQTRCCACFRPHLTAGGAYRKCDIPPIMTQADLVSALLSSEKTKRKKDRKKRMRPQIEQAEHPSRDRPLKLSKKRKENKMESFPSDHRKLSITSEVSSNSTRDTTSTKTNFLGFDSRYILAPMVGASDLPFRLLCRKYGAQLAYTPMMSASQFGTDEAYRKEIFQTTQHDRPLVCHFSANRPEDFAQAAKVAEKYCDAIDLNLGCPQRTAYVGHFGSYLLDDGDRKLVLDIIKAGVEAVAIPIFVKIRLLDTPEKTLELCQQLVDAGASLIAIHARYRATFQRNGPGARDGPALLDQIGILRRHLPPSKVLLVTNGNTITYDDVVENLKSTKADGIMSAEGILDNPALYLGRWGSREESEKEVEVFTYPDGVMSQPASSSDDSVISQKDRRKIQKKIKKIDNKLESASDSKKKKLFAKKSKYEKRLKELSANDPVVPLVQDAKKISFKLGDLYDRADDKVGLALEYLQLVRLHPIPIRSLIFHTRRILKQQLTSYQLMEECLSCETFDDVQKVLDKVHSYESDPGLFQFDREKAARDKEALERKRHEEGKRKAYEARMMRKAKREKKHPEFYLRQGAAVPTQATVSELRSLDKAAQLAAWRDREHSQHCLAYHLGTCSRGRSCAFLHVDPSSATTFDEQNEVAG